MKDFVKIETETPPKVPFADLAIGDLFGSVHWGDRVYMKIPECFDRNDSDTRNAIIISDEVAMRGQTYTMPPSYQVVVFDVVSDLVLRRKAA